jgi:23S rRNA pseudouridine1911/1915/1917 synthase
LSKHTPEILLDTKDLVLVNKPAHLLSIPDRIGKDPSLKLWLQEKYGSIFTVHRLDRETSGLILFAKNEEAHKFLSAAFEERTVEKIYTGIVSGILTEKKGTIAVGLMEHPVKKGTMVTNKKGKASLTDYEVLEEFGMFSLVQFRIHTGRTHQIRVHMQYIGHPILCDELYGSGKPIYLSSLKKGFRLSKFEEEEKPLLSRLALHASRLAFTAPTGEKYAFDAPMPKDMRALLSQIRKVRK